MSEKIIYIKGAAYPKTQDNALWEMKYTQACVTSLQKAGHEVTQVGVAWRGFYDHHLRDAFKKSPGANLVIVDAHGNIKDRKHYLAARHEDLADIWAEDFYKTLAEVSGDRPLNVFMFSCGSGNGCEAATKHLPQGSTLVNMAREENDLHSYHSHGMSYVPNSNYLEVDQNSGRTYAEELFLNLLSKGHKDTMNHYPQITICKKGMFFPGVTWTLWEVAIIETLMEDRFTSDFQQGLKDFLHGHFSEDVLMKSLRCIEFYVRAHEKSFEGYEEPEAPLKIHYKIDEHAFMDDARKSGLFSAMCAIAYYAHRERIGAFKAGIARDEDFLPRPVGKASPKTLIPG